MNTTRRNMLLGAGASAALGAASGIGAGQAFAKGPVVGKQALGVHRMKLGAFEVTTLLDGFIDVPPMVLMGDQAAVKDLLDASRNAGRMPLRLPVNAFVVNTGEKLVLIDTGGAKLIGPNAGRLPDALALAGMKPEDIDEICITHMHGDHLHGAVTPEGKAFLPNAVLRVAQPDVDYWTNSDIEAKAPDNQKGRFVAAKRAVAAYGDRLKPFKLGDEITPGITSVPAAGHTPGHSCYMVQSGDAKLLLVGDLLHVAPVQFPRPEITVAFDWDQDAARASRKALLDRVVSERLLIGAVHLAFPGIGALRMSGTGYAFDPIPWQLD